MTTQASRMMFVNLPVRDLSRSMAFFQKLGFVFDQRFCDDTAACMVVGAGAFVMLITEKKFETFTTKRICDAKTHKEVLLALSAASRAEVDELTKKAVAQGGTLAGELVDHGPMYYRTFHDLDGHHWEVIYMDPAAFADGPPNLGETS